MLRTINPIKLRGAPVKSRMKALRNRNPEEGGWDILLAELNAGKERGEILDGFLYFQGFSELCEDYGINPY